MKLKFGTLKSLICILGKMVNFFFKEIGCKKWYLKNIYDETKVLGT